MNRIAHKRPAPGTVVGMVAIFVSLISSAGALPGRGAVKKGDIARGAVTARAIAPGAVKTAALRDGAVTDAKLGPGSLDGAKLAAHSVGNQALADDAVSDRVIAPDSVGGSELKGIHVVSGGPYTDPDSGPPDFTWVSSGYVGHTATCPLGETLLSGGVSTGGGNQRGFLQASLPLSPDATSWAGAISSDTGGSSPYTVYALCLVN